MRFRAAFFLVLAWPALHAQDARFTEIPPAAADSLRFDKALPDVEIKDTQGRIWRTEDFRGKFTLVYVWHTFEARTVDAHAGHEPLMREIGFPDLREVQRFYDKAKGTTRLQVLTFCADYDYTHAPEYMKRAGYTFPVVADWKLIDKILGPAIRIARYAVIGPEGKLSAPFRSWTLGRLLIELEAIAGN